MWENIHFQQILIITDGCSNVGEHPSVGAAVAKQKEICVNVIGILDGGQLGRHGEQEIQSIANAGGGSYRVVSINQLAQTMQMLTRQTQHMTMKQVVNQQLKQLIGHHDTDLPPQTRMEVAYMIDLAQEESGLRIVLLIDVSASMREKMAQVIEAIRDFESGLQARKGSVEVALIAYPGRNGQEIQLLSDFSAEVELESLAKTIIPSGGTPTGPAIYEAIRLFKHVQKNRDAYNSHLLDNDGDASSYVV